MNASHNVLTEAVRLLVDIAGTEPVHIEMSARGPKKYYDVRRMFDERDGRAHLLGYRTKGATLRHPGGMTRALCYDADTPGDWQLLQEAAKVLAESGSIPLLEVSPVGRGGHLWIIYTGLVSADQARGNIVGTSTSSERDSRVLAWIRVKDVQGTPARGKVCAAGFLPVVHAHRCLWHAACN